LFCACKAFFEETKEKLAAFDAEVATILLPKQVERLHQIDRQITVEAAGPSLGLTNTTMIDELKLTSEQVEAVKKDAAELEAKLKEKIEEFRQEILKTREASRRDILKHLSDQQRRDYVRLIGDIVEINKSEINKP
jgi:hypothetical protein